MQDNVSIRANTYHVRWQVTAVFAQRLHGTQEGLQNMQTFLHVIHARSHQGFVSASQPHDNPPYTWNEGTCKGGS